MGANGPSWRTERAPRFASSSSATNADSISTMVGRSPTTSRHPHAELWILEQPPHQRRARVLPFVVAHTARQEHLCLDAEQPRRHFGVVRRLIQPQLPDHRQELVHDLRDRQIGDVELVLLNKVQQKVEGTGELLQLDDEAVVVLHDRIRGRAQDGNAPCETANPLTRARPTPINWYAGQSNTCSTPGKAQTRSMTGRNPNSWSRRYRDPAPGGSR